MEMGTPKEPQPPTDDEVVNHEPVENDSENLMTDKLPEVEEGVDDSGELDPSDRHVEGVDRSENT
jgi:hypothetical protein